MDMPTLLSAFMVCGGDSVQGPSGLDPAGSGAEFEAGLILADGVAPAPDPAGVLPKTADKAVPVAQVAQRAPREQEAGVELPVCWQALVCNPSERPDIPREAPLAKDAPAKDDPAPNDAALAQAVVVPVLVPINLAPPQGACGTSAVSEVPKVGSTQETAKAGLPTPGYAWALEPLQGERLTGQVTLEQAATLQAPPTAPDQTMAQTIASKPDSLTADDVLPAREPPKEKEGKANPMQALPTSAARQAAHDSQTALLQGDDVATARGDAGEKQARPQTLPHRSAPTGEEDQSHLPNRRLTDGLALPEFSTGFETVDSKGAVQVAKDSGGQVQMVSAQSTSQTAMGQQLSVDAPKVTRGIGFAPVEQAQPTQAAPKPSSRKTQPDTAGWTPQPASVPRAYPPAGPTEKPPSVRPDQAVPPAKPLIRPAEAAATDDSDVAKTRFAPSAAQDAVVPANPQALGGSPPPHLQIPMQSALPPKTAQALHAQLPTVIEHLHHGGAHDGHNRAEVLLNPAELGRIRFDLITQGDQVHINLTVERPETLDLMRAHAETLRQEFRAAGLNTDTLNFGQWAQRAPSRDQPETVSRDVVDSLSPPQIIAAPYVKPVSASGLDLRL